MRKIIPIQFDHELWNFTPINFRVENFQSTQTCLLEWKIANFFYETQNKWKFFINSGDTTFEIWFYISAGLWWSWNAWELKPEKIPKIGENFSGIIQNNTLVASDFNYNKTEDLPEYSEYPACWLENISEYFYREYLTSPLFLYLVITLPIFIGIIIKKLLDKLSQK